MSRMSGTPTKYTPDDPHARDAAEETPPTLQLSTPRCQPWCHTHSLDTSEVELYNGVPHYFHEAQSVETRADDGKPIVVKLDLFEPANDPDGFEPTLKVLVASNDDSGFEWETLHCDELPITDARVAALAMIAMCDRAEGAR